jgi:hypothetical protein
VLDFSDRKEIKKENPHPIVPDPKKKITEEKQKENSSDDLEVTGKGRRWKATPACSILMRTFSGASEKKDRAVEGGTPPPWPKGRTPSGAKCEPPSTFVECLRHGAKRGAVLFHRRPPALPLFLATVGFSGA